MRVFVTGATGFVGSAVVAELIGAGHQVIGLTRSESGAASLVAAGAEAQRGELEDLESLRSGAERSEGVIHCAFDHDFSKFAANCAMDGRVIEALGGVLRGSRRPLIVTSATGMGSAKPGEIATEGVFDENNPNLRKTSELAGASALQSGVNVSVVRLSQVHDTVKQGLVTYAVGVAREKGVSAYVGDGGNRWAAVHLMDAARLYRLALEKAEAGARYHAVAEEGVPFRSIAETVGKGLKIPTVSMSRDEAAAHFGWLAMFVDSDLAAASSQTQQRLGWRPGGPGLIRDLEEMRYF